MKRLSKFLDRIIPINRRVYINNIKELYKTIDDLVTTQEKMTLVIDGFLLSEQQHSQMEMNFMRELQGLKALKIEKKPEAQKNDVAFN
jgi:hypothetical protein